MIDAATVQEELLDHYKDLTGIKRFEPSYSWRNALSSLPDLLRQNHGGSIPSGRVFIEHADLEAYSEDGGNVCVIFRVETYDGEELFFRNDGWADSWSEATWDGELYRVVRKPKNTYDYERA